MSLIQAIYDQAGIPLREAKGLVEDLLAGRAIVVSFADATQRNAFRALACNLGARCE